MKITKFMNAVMMTAAITFGGGAVQAQQSGGSLVFLVQPEPPTMAGYVSTSGPIGLLGPKIYDGLFDYDNDDIMEYLVENSITYSDATPVSPEIMQVHTDDSYAYHVVLKTHWLRLVQRCWKKIINNRRRIIQNPAYVRSRELRGNNEANLPGLRGMLSCMK